MPTLSSRFSRLTDYLLAKYEWLLSFLLRINVVKVRQERFVRKVITTYHKADAELLVQKAMESSLAEVLTPDEQRKYYRRLMHRHGWSVFLVSFICTLVPDEMIYVVVSCAIDLIFFQCVLFIAMQQVLLLYGSACDLHNDQARSMEKIISIDSSGLMLGKYPLLQKMKSVVGWAGKQLVKRVGPRLVTQASRSAFIVIRRQSVKWFSLVIAKEHVDLAFKALIPITCGIISGIVSVVIFVPMCNKLRRNLNKS